MYYEQYDRDKLERAILQEVIESDLFGVVVDYCMDSGYETPMDEYTLDDIIDNMDPQDAFRLGWASSSDFSWGSEYVIFDGYGNLKDITRSEFISYYVNEYGVDSSLLDYIIDNNLINDLGLDSEDFVIEDEEEE